MLPENLAPRDQIVVSPDPPARALPARLVRKESKESKELPDTPARLDLRGRVILAPREPREPRVQLVLRVPRALALLVTLAPRAPSGQRVPPEPDPLVQLV